MEHGADTSQAAAAALLDGMSAGDTRALERLYGLFSGLVHGLALRILLDPAEAEEVTQDVFLYLWQQPRRFDPTRGNLTSYLAALTRSRSIDRLRARDSQGRRQQGLALEAGATAARDESADPLENMLLGERRRRVQAGLAALPEEQQQALEIAYFEGLSHVEIAARLGIPLGTVKTRIRQGMIRLRAAMAAS